ncbi:hypothetical protein C8Q78DRAFT_977900, partial [Trametes maxima]
DNSGVVFMALVGKPKDREGWDGVNREVQEAFETARKSFSFKPEQEDHRRGSFPAFAVGISFGGGQVVRNNFAWHQSRRQNQKVIGELLSNRGVCRLAGFSDASMRLLAPRMHAYYQETLQALEEDDPTLRRNFQNSAFACATFNLGPQVVTVEHADSFNLPAGWCAIHAIGEFDPTRGGHLLLWDLKLMIEFPPGALILIPSALLRHSNTTIGPNETRYSFTQYSAGGLFRWVECGFQTLMSFEKGGGRLDCDGRGKWALGTAMFSTCSELRGRAHRKAATH